MISLNPRVLLAAPLLAAASLGADPGPLAIYSPDFPVSFFFRESDVPAAARRMPFPVWDARYSRLAGIQCEMLDEEILGRSATQDYYRRFKAAHPEQAILLHTNISFRNPNADNKEFFPGHWLYYNGARVLDAVPSAGDETTLRVADVTVFNLHPYGANPAIPDDVGLCGLDAAGEPDWTRAEQTQLAAIDPERGTITLRRGRYHSVRQEFPPGGAYVAAHVAQTWGTENKLWQLNVSTTCPVDRAGKDAAAIWAGQLIGAMKPGGAIDFADGAEFEPVAPAAIVRPRRALPGEIVSPPEGDCRARRQNERRIPDSGRSRSIGPRCPVPFARLSSIHAVELLIPSDTADTERWPPTSGRR